MNRIAAQALDQRIWIIDQHLAVQTVPGRRERWMGMRARLLLERDAVGRPAPITPTHPPMSEAVGVNWGEHRALVPTYARRWKSAGFKAGLSDAEIADAANDGLVNAAFANDSSNFEPWARELIVQAILKAIRAARKVPRDGNYDVSLAEAPDGIAPDEVEVVEAAREIILSFPFRWQFTLACEGVNPWLGATEEQLSRVRLVDLDGTPVPHDIAIIVGRMAKGQIDRMPTRDTARDWGVKPAKIKAVVQGIVKAVAIVASEGKIA